MNTLIYDLKLLYKSFNKNKYEEHHSDIITAAENWGSCNSIIMKETDSEIMLDLLIYELHTKNRKSTILRYFTRFRELRNQSEKKDLMTLHNRVNDLSSKINEEKESDRNGS